MDSSLTTHEIRSGLVVSINGRFDHHLYHDFHALCDRVQHNQQIIINLENTTALDNSALEMLLLLREHTAQIVLKHPSPGITRILTVANFDKLFKIITPTPA